MWSDLLWMLGGSAVCFSTCEYSSFQGCSISFGFVMIHDIGNF